MSKPYRYVTVKISPEAQQRLLQLRHTVHPDYMRGRRPSIARLIDYLLDSHEPKIVTPAAPKPFPSEAVTGATLAEPTAILHNEASKSQPEWRDEDELLLETPAAAPQAEYKSKGILDKFKFWS